MEPKALVAYASKYGSTREVAEAVTAALCECALDAESRPMREVRSLDGYGLVVLGAPLYMLRWHGDALRFLALHRQALIGRPVAVFALGPFHDEPKEWQEVAKELDKELARFPWFKPVARQVFGGKFDPATLVFPWKLIPALRHMPPSDIRDWTAIHAWAKDLTGKFQPAVAQ